MAPVGQYVFAEMLGISEHFTAGSHEWLPYSDFPTFPKQSAKHQFVSVLAKADGRFYDTAWGRGGKNCPAGGAGQAVGYSDSPFRRAVIRVRAYCMAS